MAAAMLMTSTGRGEIILGGDFNDGSSTPTLTITAPIILEITGSGNANYLVFDEWLPTPDASVSAVSAVPSGQKLTVLNHGALVTPAIITLSDNLISPQGSVSANDGFLRFSATPVTSGRKFTIAAGTYIFSTDTAFNPALKGKTFSGNVFLGDESMARLSDDVSLAAPPSIPIKNFTVGHSLVQFSFMQPRKEYLVASTNDLNNWDLTKIYESNQSEVIFTTPRIITSPARAFFTVCELSTTNKVHSGNFAFTSTVESARNGRLFEVEVDEFGQKASMQSRVTSTVGEREAFKLTASVDLNDLTIDILGLTASLHSDGLGYSFELREDLPRELVEEASNEEVQFYSQISEIYSGRYDLCSGTISIEYTEVSNLTWNLTSDVSTATTISSLVSFGE